MWTRAAAMAGLLLLAAAAGAQTTRWYQRTNATTVGVDVSEGGQFVVEGRLSGLYLYDRAGNLLWGKNLGDVSRVALSPGAERIAVAAGGKVHLLNQAGEVLWQYGESGVQFISVDVSRDRVIAGTSGGRLVMLDFAGSVVWAKPLCSGVQGLSFSPDRRQIAAAAATCVYLLDLQGNELLTRNPNAEARMAAGGRDRVTYGVRDGVFHSAAIEGPAWRVTTGTAPVALSMAPAGWFLIASGWDLYIVSDSGGIVKPWNSPSPGQSGPIQDAALSPDGSVLVFAVPSNLTLWESLPAPPAPTPAPTPSPTATGKVVYVCPDKTTADDPALCPRAPSPTPPPSAVSGPSPSAAPPLPPGTPAPIPIGPVAAAAAGIAGVVLAIRWARKNREAIDRWRLQRRMRRI